ncbi:hypothetical protein BU17DRAFT_51020 [Hysterangium stoloniferum]|nr:hypothetical protein BU17DRAFT_51020 [Hysterangium stoloniferum]
MSVPDDYVVDAYSVPPTTPPQSFARPPKQIPSSYPDPTGFPTPPSYPPVPGLVACGSSSTSARSSAYTSPGGSAPLSSSDLSAVGFGLGRLVNREDESDAGYVEDGDLDIGAAITTDKAFGVPPRTPYAHTLVREASESSIARLQFATNAAAASASNGSNVVPQGWGEPYATSTRSRNSSYEGISRSASVSGLTSASEDETDADEYNYNFLQEIVEGDEEARTAAVVVAEEGRGLIVHGEGQDVASVNIQLGTTHLLLASSATPNSIPSLLIQTLPNIASTLLALDISANFLSALPLALVHCVQLTELNIANNPLRTLPVWLAKLEDLRVLIADSTGLSTLPPELGALKELNVLSIRRNKLVSLPPWLSHLSALERLEVEGNPFQGPWVALLAPLIAGSQPNASISIPGQQAPSISTSSSISDFNSVYGPGMSMYADSSTSFLPNEEDHTIMPRSFTSSSQASLAGSSHLPVPSSSTPLSPAPLTASSPGSFVSSNSPSQLPYMSTSPTLTSSSEQGSEEFQNNEKKIELRRMRSADELRRALESVLSPPSQPMPPFLVPKLDARPGMKPYHSENAAGTIGSTSGASLLDRPTAKRFASMSAAHGNGVPIRNRAALSDGMWDAGGDADAEGDNEESRLSKSPPTQKHDGEARSAKPSKGKWGFLKKMSMGRMRPEASNRPSTSSGTPTIRSAQTSPQTVSGHRTGIPPAHLSNGASPTPKPRQASREMLSSPPENLSPLQPNAGSGYRSNLSSSPLSLKAPQPRSARRRSFLPLDGPPALNIPIPSTSPFLPETIITNDGNEEPLKPLTLQTPPVVDLPPASPQELPQQFANDSRALRSVMAYLRDMADLGMANSVVVGPPLGTTPSTANSSQEAIDGRPTRPNAVDNGHVMSEGSLASSSSSGPPSLSRSDEQRTNTMSTATTDSNGSGKDEERSKHKDDKSKRALIVKEIVETERTYVQGLQELLDIYIKPASSVINTLGNAVASTKETVIPQQERKIVFNGLDSLYSFHSQSFLPALEHAAKPLLHAPSLDTTAGEVSMGAAMAVANVFVSHAAFMKMYSTYINNFDNAVQRLKHWTVDRRTTPVISPNSSTAHLAGMGLQMSVVSVAGAGDNVSSTGLQLLTTSQRKRIKQYLKRCRLNPRHSQINLEAYLLLPIQRIPRYRMLLEELVRCTPPMPDALDDPMDRALNEISSLANNMNEGKRESESRRRLVQWQARIKGKFPSPLVQPHRRLIMDGPLNLTRVVRKSAVAFDVINSDGDKTNIQVECLAPEEQPRSLVGILCNDLLVLCKDQSGGRDQNAQVDLWAVLRMQTLPQPASIVQASALRVVDNKAILYFDAPSTSEALTWCRAINMHIPATKP